MTLPRWDDPGLPFGTMIRTALWLITEVGIGNSFTKEKHRQAFARVTQADRRLRDLRNFGWVIHTSTEDLTLNPNEQRFVAMGLPVWERGVRTNSGKEKLTAKKRMAILGESSYQCVVCGIAGGESYLDNSQETAVLSVARRVVILPNGKEKAVFAAECKRCRAGAWGGPVDVPQLLERIRALGGADREVFIRWANSGRRGRLDQIWADFRRIPAVAQDEVRRHLVDEPLGEQRAYDE